MVLLDVVIKIILEHGIILIKDLQKMLLLLIFLKMQLLMVF